MPYDCVDDEAAYLINHAARNAFGILWAGLTAPAGNHIEEPKNRNSEMLSDQHF